MQSLNLRLFCFVLFLALTINVAHASHFRFGHVTWQRVSDNPDGSVTVLFRSRQAWRAATVPGSELPIIFGDGNSADLNGVTITYVPPLSDPPFTDINNLPANEFRIIDYSIQHTYSAAAIAANSGRFIAELNSCCRIGDLVNAGDDAERIETVVDLNGGNSGGPIGDIPVKVQLAQGQLNTFPISFADPDGDLVTCRMATNSESLISNFASAGGQVVSVSSNCQLTWDTTGTTVGQKFAVQVIGDENRPCPAGSQLTNCNGDAALDFIIEIVQGNPPTCSGAPTSNFAFPGQNFVLNLVGADPDGDNLTVLHQGLPSGASINPAFGSTAPQPMNVQFSWTPSQADAGTAQAVTIIYRDINGLQGFCSFGIEVRADCSSKVEGAQVVDECGVCGGDGSACGCNSGSDLRSLTVALDGNGLALLNLAERLGRGNDVTSNPSTRRRYRTLLQRQMALHMDSWELASVTLPQTDFVGQCQAQVVCASFDSSGPLDQLRRNTSLQVQLLRQFIKRVGLSHTRNAGYVLRQAKRLLRSTKRKADKYPSIVSACNPNGVPV